MHKNPMMVNLPMSKHRYIIAPLDRVDRLQEMAVSSNIEAANVTLLVR